jgi:hypothetical protein
VSVLASQSLPFFYCTNYPPLQETFSSRISLQFESDFQGHRPTCTRTQPQSTLKRFRNWEERRYQKASQILSLIEYSGHLLPCLAKFYLPFTIRAKFQLLSGQLVSRNSMHLYNLASCIYAFSFSNSGLIEETQ